MRSLPLGLCGLAIVLTIAAVLKPILWDEEVYFQFARYIAQHPLDPYGASIWINGRNFDGFTVLAPPILLYWWAGAIALFESNVSLTAIALFPFALAYTASFHGLAQRLAPKLALALTVMATISAWPLVTISYMLDFPAATLELAALALFMAGSGPGRRHWVIAAGLLAGLAMETKYNAVTIVGAMLLWGLFDRRFFDALLAASVSVLLFCAVETLIRVEYGQSHFVIHIFSSAPVSNGFIREISRLRELFYGLIQNSGPLAIGILLLYPIARGKGRRFIAANIIFVVAAFALSAAGFDRILGYVIPGTTPDRMPMVLSASGLLGLAALIYGGCLIGGGSYRQILFNDRRVCFLLAWAILEVLVYFVMSPFPTARRMGEIIAATLLLVGRAVILRGPCAPIGRLVHVQVVINAICGLTMLAIALVDGWNVEATVRSAAAFMRTNAQGGEAWHMTSLGLAHYFDATGIARIDRDVTKLQPGDLLVVDFLDAERAEVLQASGLQPIATIRAGINLGVSVSTLFYRAANPWFAASDTRPAVVVLRANKPTGIPADFGG